jgi:hypothetical protein
LYHVLYVCTYCIIADLDRQAQQLVIQGIRLNTRRTYSSAQKCFIQFCNQQNLPVIPTTEQVLLWFIAFLNSKRIAASSMHVYLAAVRSMHVMAGCPPPPSSAPRVKLALKAVLESNAPPVQKYPITYLLLCHMFNLLDDGYDDIMFKSVLTLSFYGAFRSDEYVLPDSRGLWEQSHSLCLAHVSFGIAPNGVDFMSIALNRTKTTPHGIIVPIGCSTTLVCAVCTLKLYLKYRYSVMQCQLSQPLFVLASGVPLTKAVWNAKIKSLVAKLGLNPVLFSAHSLRAGAISTAASVQSAPFQAWELKSLGNWQSDTYQRYIRNVDQHKINYSKRLTQN